MNTRGRIIKAAKRLFAEKGFDRTTVDDIVRAAGIAKGTFYLHFSSKEELIKEIAMMAMPFMAFSSVLRNTNAYERLEDFLQALGESFFEYYSDIDLRILFFHVVSIKEAIPSLKEIHNRLCSELIAEGTKRLMQFVDGDKKKAEVAFRTFLGSLLHYLYSGGCSTISQREYLRKLVQMIVKGLD